MSTDLGTDFLEILLTSQIGDSHTKDYLNESIVWNQLDEWMNQVA